ncbi:MAG: hypothetical protein JXI33_08255 [Candidatus Aminicenantes bacterium]|nr:hypothetical protein [Candidatus Aminicenantes bacterium]
MDNETPFPTVNQKGPKRSLLQRLRTSSLALLTANLMPLLGVLAFNWNVMPIMVFYWTENLVIGFYNVLKMRRAQGSVAGSHTTLNGRPVQQSDRRAMIVFFILHYGLFTLCHGVFVLVLFRGGFGGVSSELGLALLLLTVSHGISYRRNFIGHGEYQRVAFTGLFWQPYSRVIVMHLTIVLGGSWAQAKGSPIFALLVLVMLKTAIDLALHLLEHKKFQRRRMS